VRCVKKFLPFVKQESLFPFSKQPKMNCILSQLNPIPTPSLCFFKDSFNITITTILISSFHGLE